jgi:kumamolisin
MIMADGRKVFSDSVTPLPAAEGTTHLGLMVAAAKPENNKEQMKVVFSLAIPADAQAKLQQMVAEGKVASPKDIAKNFSADPADAKALASWLKSEGFKVDKISTDQTSLYAHGTVEQIQKSLNVNMVRVTKDGITYTAAQNAPSLPADVGKNVSAIVGLQPFRRAHKQFRICTPQSGVPAPARHTKRTAARTAAKKTSKTGRNGKAAAPAAAVPVTDGYLVPEILKAYNADGLPLSGKGQTIAILIDTFPTPADLKAFWKLNGLKTTIKQIEMINVNGGSLPPLEGEETLDAQWTSGIAPGAKIKIYASGTLSFADLDSALDRIITDLATEPGMRQLSISLGLGETFMAPDEVKAQSQKFLRLAASGVNVFVASGDAGSNPDATGHSSGGPIQVEYEASDINVIAVGGTTLNLASDGSVDSETAWVGSGGGRSGLFKRQPWQQGAGVPSGTERLVPDVSLAADPNTGACVILHGVRRQIGGTSWSTPVWAGFCALINEARANAGKPALTFLPPQIYKLSGSANFRDVTDGSNGAFNAGNGYDMVTGLGVPNVKQLVSSLS